MTEQNPALLAETTPQSPTPTVVTPEPDSRLDALTAEWATLKPQLDELKTRVDELSKGIKAETMRAAPEGSSEAVLRSPHLDTAYRVSPSERWTLDTRAMKAEAPETYVRFAKRSTTWRLDPIK